MSKIEFEHGMDEGFDEYDQFLEQMLDDKELIEAERKLLALDDYDAMFPDDLMDGIYDGEKIAAEIKAAKAAEDQGGKKASKWVPNIAAKEFTPKAAAKGAAAAAS